MSNKVDKKRPSLQKNIIVEGIFGSEVPDTTGEVLNVAGADISHLPNGFLNTEHRQPSDEEKDGKPDFDGFQSIIGRVISAKKIFSEKDCKSDREKRAWNQIKRPLIYGQAEIWDGPDAHDNAKAAASIVKMLSKSPDSVKIGFSVEGSTLKRDGHKLENTLIRGLALTLKPCNRTARGELIEDSSENQVRKSEYLKNYKGTGEALYKTSTDFVETISNNNLKEAFTKLQKTLTAGGIGASAPASVTDGGALQASESSLRRLAKYLGKSKPKKDELMATFPKMKENEAVMLEKALKDEHIRQMMELTDTIYNNLSKGK